MGGIGSGGYLVGAGRKKLPRSDAQAPVDTRVAAPAAKSVTAERLISGGIPAPAAKPESPLEFMLRVMNDPTQDAATRMRMAVTSAQYVHTKIKDGGKKDARKTAAAHAGAGKFSPAAPPRLSVVKP